MMAFMVSLQGCSSQFHPRPPRSWTERGPWAQVQGPCCPQSLIDSSTPPQSSSLPLLSSWPISGLSLLRAPQRLVGSQLSCYLLVTHLSGHCQSSVIKFVTDFNPITVQTWLIRPSGYLGLVLHLQTLLRKLVEMGAQRNLLVLQKENREKANQDPKTHPQYVNSNSFVSLLLALFQGERELTSILSTTSRAPTTFL